MIEWKFVKMLDICCIVCLADQSSPTSHVFTHLTADTLSPGSIIGIVLGVIFGIVLIAVVVLICQLTSGRWTLDSYMHTVIHS